MPGPNEKAIVWSIRVLYVLCVTDSGLCSFNLGGGEREFFISQAVLHFAFIFCSIVSVVCAVPHALTRRLKLRIAVMFVISSIKFGILFLHYIPYNAFFMNFIFYASIIDLSFACLSP
jgi:hypothetical protein